MPRDLSAELLGEVAGRVMEEAAFFFSKQVPPVGSSQDSEIFPVELAFEGPKHGKVRLTAPSAFATELAANFLGTEINDPSAKEQAKAALAELLNMICGTLMVELFGLQTVCHLGLPQFTLDAVGSGQPTCAATLLMNDMHRIELDVFIEPRAL